VRARGNAGTRATVSERAGEARAGMQLTVREGADNWDPAVSGIGRPGPLSEREGEGRRSWAARARSAGSRATGYAGP